MPTEDKNNVRLSKKTIIEKDQPITPSVEARFMYPGQTYKRLSAMMKVLGGNERYHFLTAMNKYLSENNF